MLRTFSRELAVTLKNEGRRGLVGLFAHPRRQGSTVQVPVSATSSFFYQQWCVFSFVSEAITASPQQDVAEDAALPQEGQGESSKNEGGRGQKDDSKEEWSYDEGSRLD